MIVLVGEGGLSYQAITFTGKTAITYLQRVIGGGGNFIFVGGNGIVQ